MPGVPTRTKAEEPQDTNMDWSSDLDLDSDSGSNSDEVAYKRWRMTKGGRTGFGAPRANVTEIEGRDMYVRQAQART